MGRVKMQLKEKLQTVAGFSKLKFGHFREMLKDRSVSGELAQRNLPPEYPLILLHGYGNRPSAWKKHLKYFKSNGYIEDENLFLFDGRGTTIPRQLSISVLIQRNYRPSFSKF